MFVFFGLSMASFAWADVQGQLLEKGTDLPVIANVACGENVVISNTEGFFVIKGDCSTLQVLSNYHLPFSMENPSTSEQLILWLQPKSQQETLLVEEKREPAHGVAYGMDAEQLQKMPGGFDDPIRLLQSLPGAVATREYGANAGDVILRGAAPHESRLYIDGVEVPYLYHFQQYASILPTALVDNVIMYPSNFGASYGDSTGGIIALESKEATAEEPQINIQGNLIMTGAQISSPLGKGVLSLSGRRSFADLYESSNEQYSLWPVFSDYVARYDIRNAEGHHFRWTALGAMDAYGRYIYDADDLDPYERQVNPNLQMRRRFDGGVFRWDWRSPEYRARTSLAMMRDNWTADIASDSQQRLDQYSWLRHESIVIRDNTEWSVGFDQRLGNIQQNVSTSQAYPIVQADAPLLAQGDNLDRSVWEWRVGTWVEPRVNIGNWRFISGIRLQSLPLQADMVVDPRVQIHHQATDNLSWHLGLGRYHQSPLVDVTSEIAFAKSNQASTGMEWQISNSSIFSQILSVDAWVKNTFNKIHWSPSNLPLLVDEEAFGGEVLWGANLHDSIESRMGFSMVHSTLIFQDQEYVSPYTQPISLNAMLSWHNDHWMLGARYRYSSGLMLSEPIAAIYDGNTDQYQPNWGDFPSRKMPDYQKIDAQIVRMMTIRDWKIRAYCEAWVVPSSANFLYPIYNYNYSESQLVVGPSMMPLIGLSAQH